MLILGVHPIHHGLGVAPRALSHFCGAAPVSDLIESQSPLAGAGMGSAHGQPPQVLWCLTPAGPINLKHHAHPSEARASDGEASRQSKPPQTTALKLDGV